MHFVDSGIIGRDILVILGQDDLTDPDDPGEMAFLVDQYWLHEDFQ